MIRLKIKVFSDFQSSKLENVVNEFLKNHGKIEKIEFSTSQKDNDDMVYGDREKMFYSVMIAYDG